MLKKVKKISWHIIFNCIAYSLVFFLIEQIIYNYFLSTIELQSFWMLTSIVLYLISVFIGKIANRNNLSSIFFSITNLI